MNPYEYPGGEPNFTLGVEKANSKWSRRSVEFVTAGPASHDEGRIARGEYFQPLRANNIPLAIILHGLGDRSAIPCKLLARSLVNRGIACFILYSLFHSSRMPEAVKKRAPAFTSEEWLEGYRASVIEVRQIANWARSRPEINHEQVAVVGISLGGFISAIAMGVEERLRAGMFITMGGNSRTITWMSKADTFRKSPTCTEEECQRVHAQYPQYLAEVAERGFDNVTPLRQCFLTDAMTFAHSLRGRPVLMINALWDKYIPKQATVEFWEACGEPAITWLPAGHASIWALYPLISRRVARFLGFNFNL
jgi:cephalosporin-C deacetylase-like acetyl esterase